MTAIGPAPALQASALQTDATLEIYSDLISASRKLEQLKNQPGVSQDTLDRLEESILGMRASLERAVRRIRDDLDLQLAVLTARKATVLEELGRIPRSTDDGGRHVEDALDVVRRKGSDAHGAPDAIILFLSSTDSDKC